MHRVVIYEPAGLESASLFAALREQGFELVECSDGQMLLEEVVQHRPDVVVYGLRPDGHQDLGVLHLVRSVAPELPLVLVASEGSLVTQKLVQDVRPIYYAVYPVDPAELHEAVRAALARRARPGVMGL